MMRTFTKIGKILFSRFIDLYDMDLINILKHAANIFNPIYHSDNKIVMNNQYEKNFNVDTGLLDSTYYSEYTGSSFIKHYTTYYFSFEKIKDSEFDMHEFIDYKQEN